MRYVRHEVRAQASATSKDLYGATIVVPVARESYILRDRFPHGYTTMKRGLLPEGITQDALQSHRDGGAYVELEDGSTL